ncbi:hypothetical protein SCALM49S_06579 [Streptomyces californicus]
MPTGSMSSASTASRSSWVSVTMRFGCAGIPTALPVASLTVRVAEEAESALPALSPEGLPESESEPQAVRSRVAARGRRRPERLFGGGAGGAAVGPIKGSGFNGT